jgi:diguanylate cyclase (GGDEF)-like protein/PAS domain S-box-containing protein
MDLPISQIEEAIDIIVLLMIMIPFIFIVMNQKRIMKEAEERYKAISDDSPIGIYVYEDGKITYVNSQLAKMTGYSKDELLSMDIMDLIVQEDHSIAMDSIQKIMSGLEPNKVLQIKGMKKDRNIVEFEGHGTLTSRNGKPAIVGSVLDITQRKQMENELKESQEKYKRLILLSPDPILIHDGNKILFVNDKAVSLLGAVSFTEIIGQSIYDFIRTDFREITSSRVNQMFETKKHLSISELKIKNLQEQLIDIEISSGFISYKGKPAIQVIMRDITERKTFEQKLIETNETLRELSTVDGLTGIPNRRYFDYKFQEEWIRAARSSSKLALFMVDIDYFKTYNDTYGHQAGDDCLKKVAKTLQENLNRTDDFVARYGGEEFIVVLPNTDDKGASVVAEFLRKKVEEISIPHIGSEISHCITISLGIASTIPRIDAGPHELIEMADKALYLAKKDGRNRFKLYN